MFIKHRSGTLFRFPKLIPWLGLVVGLLTVLAGSWVGGAASGVHASEVSNPLDSKALPSIKESPELLPVPASNFILLAQNQTSPLLQFGSEGPDVQALQTLLQLLGYYSGVVNGRYQESTVTAVSAFQSAASLNADGIVGPTTWERLLPSIAQVQTIQGSQSDVDSPLGNQSATQSASSGIGSTPTDSNSSEDSNSPSSVERTDSAVGNSASEERADSTPAASSSTNEPIPEISLPTLRMGMRGPAVQSLQERLSSLGLLQGTIDGVFGSQTEESVKSAQRYFNLNPDGIVGPATWRVLLQ
ncbi:MAG: peptidoglycan-binding domain-containing protein [Cyanobacteria bacterium P01_F01_bin.150]